MPKEIQESANFRIYISKVSKQVKPTSSMTKESSNEINRLVHDLAERVVNEAAVFAHSNHRNTILLKDIRGASDVIIKTTGLRSGEKGEDSVLAYERTTEGQKTTRAGLIFPPSRVESIIRYHTHMRVAEKASVYLAGVLENVVADLCDLVRIPDNARITTKHISDAMLNDMAYVKLFHNTFLSGGVQRKFQNLGYN